MPPTLQLPDLRRILDDLRRRLEILERRIRAIEPTTTDDEIIFSLSGALTTSTSPKAYLRNTSNLVAVVCSLSTAGSSTTTVQVKKNGSTVVTVSLTSGQTLIKATAGVPFVKDSDALTVTISAAGTSAAGLTVQNRFS